MKNSSNKDEKFSSTRQDKLYIFLPQQNYGVQFCYFATPHKEALCTCRHRLELLEYTPYYTEDWVIEFLDIWDQLIKGQGQNPILEDLAPWLWRVIHISCVPVGDHMCCYNIFKEKIL